MSDSPIHIVTALFPEHLEAVREIFVEYGESLGIDLGFQNFDAELATLPGKYAAPEGHILLAMRDGQAVGCVALRPLAGTTCEMKRLYVRPAGRGQQLGKTLAQTICRVAQEAGYSRIVLDTLASMHAALHVYKTLGFEVIEPYVFNPLPDATFLGRDLSARSHDNA
ncbi:MAG: GNAT family N-acetyltransferase [Janthinobacterium lividum]